MYNRNLKKYNKLNPKCIKCHQSLSYYRWATEGEDIHEVCQTILTTDKHELKQSKEVN